MITFVAQAAGYEVDEVDEVVEVGFSEGVDGTGRSILINRSTADGALDAEFGMNSYCVSNELGNSDYGGLSEVRLIGNQVQLTFSDHSARILGTDKVIAITLAVSDEIKQEVHAGIREIVSWGRLDAIPVLVDFDKLGKL